MRIIIVLMMALLFRVGYASNLNETFDKATFSGFTQEVLRSRKATISPNDGIEQSNALTVFYRGSDRGGERVVASQILDEVFTTATLEFSVKFCPNFNFVQGGKLHALGPLHPVTGGKPITPEGWSARLMFRKDGGLMTYIYHQDMNQKFGTTKVAEKFNLLPDRYYKLKMIVHLNSRPDNHDGRVHVYVDDKRLITHENLRFRSEINDKSSIRKFLFSTFHGGSTKDWAPINDEGEYKTECALFDNIIVK